MSLLGWFERSSPTGLILSSGKLDLLVCNIIWGGQIRHTNWWGQIRHTNWWGQIHHTNWWGQIPHTNWWGQIHHTNWWGQIHQTNWWGQIHHTNWCDQSYQLVGPVACVQGIFTTSNCGHRHKGRRGISHCGFHYTTEDRSQKQQMFFFFAYIVCFLFVWAFSGEIYQQVQSMIQNKTQTEVSEDYCVPQGEILRLRLRLHLSFQFAETLICLNLAKPFTKIQCMLYQPFYLHGFIFLSSADVGRETEPGVSSCGWSKTLWSCHSQPASVSKI